MLGGAVSHASVVTVDGYPAPRELWAYVRPKAGTHIHVYLYPQGGGTGKVLRLVAVAVLMYFTAGIASGAILGGVTGATAGATLASTALALGVSVAGMLAINALIPPPKPQGMSGGASFNALNSITGTSNQVNPYGVIPCVVGTYRFFPCHAALPYTEILGTDQYLRMLLDLGYGDLDISDIQIDSTALGQYDGVEYEITTTPTLFT